MGLVEHLGNHIGLQWSRRVFGELEVCCIHGHVVKAKQTAQFVHIGGLSAGAETGAWVSL